MSCSASSNPNSYIIGAVPKLAVIFRSESGLAVEPTTVKFKYKTPSGVITTLTYGVDTEIEKNPTTKEYSIELPADEAGSWIYRWESTGNYQAAAEGRFIVMPSQV